MWETKYFLEIFIKKQEFGMIDRIVKIFYGFLSKKVAQQSFLLHRGNGSEKIQ